MTSVNPVWFNSKEVCFELVARFLFLFSSERYVADKTLSEEQKRNVAEKLSRAIINKESPHPADLRRASLILYDLNRLGYNVTDYVVNDIIGKSNNHYSETMKKWLGNMANAYSDLIVALDDPQYSAFRINEMDP